MKNQLLATNLKPRNSQTLSQEICECGFMRVNGSKRYPIEHFCQPYTCLKNAHKKILTIDECQICGQKLKPKNFGEIFAHLKMHNIKNELLLKQNKKIDLCILEFTNICDFMVKGEVCLLAKYKSMYYDESEECEYLHAKAKSSIFKQIIAEIPNLRSFDE